jgi:hypothetical protein
VAMATAYWNCVTSSEGTIREAVGCACRRRQEGRVRKRFSPSESQTVMTVNEVN